MSVVVRPMGRADLAAVAVLEAAVFGEEAWSADMLAAELAGEPGGRYYLVAEEDGALAGYGGLLAPGGSQADVLTLAVSEDRWGRGIGAALLVGLMTEARRCGATEVFLEVRVDNDRAQRLYRRFGFAQVGVRRGYYQPSGADALVMRREIGPAAGRGQVQAGGVA